MEEEELGTSRVKELEAMVQKLRNENKRLLTKVDTPAEEHSNGYHSEDDLIAMGNSSDIEEDEWLYTSPVRPPTKDQKKLTPRQWLEQGAESIKGLSLGEAQQVLSFTLDEEERFSGSSKRSPLPGKGGRRGGGRQQQLLPSSTTSPKPQHNRDTAATNNHSPPPMKIKWTPKAYSDSEGEEEEGTIQVGVAQEGTLEETPVDNPPSSTVDNSLKVSSWNPTTLSDEEEPVPVVVGKWRVKQIPAEEEEERIGVEQVPVDEQVPAGNKWRVKQVPADEPAASVEPQQQKWKVKQVEETLDVQENVPVTDDTPTQDKWRVKQVPESSGETTPPQDNATPTVASLQRSGTFTKTDRKIFRPRGDGNPLRMKWTHRDPSPASSEEDLHQNEGGGPNFTSYPTLPRPGKEETAPTQRGVSPIQRGISPLQRGVSPHQRGVSPVRHGTSPLQYNRGSPGKALNRTSRSPSPSPLTTPTSSLRPPSPARTAGNNGGQNRRQLPTPNRIRSPRQQMTPPTGASRQGQSNTRPQMTTPPQRSGLVTPKTTPTSGTRGSGLVGPKGSPRPSNQGIPVSRPVRGGAGQQRVARQPVVKRSTDEGWLDDCY